jgi:hypothetical protein
MDRRRGEQVSTVKATFTFEGEDNAARIIEEIIMNAESYNHARIMANNGQDFQLEYTYVETQQGEVVGMGSGYMDSEECY